MNEQDQASKYGTQQQTFRNNVTSLFAGKPSLNNVIDSADTTLFTDLSEGKVTPIIPATTVASTLEDNNLGSADVIETSIDKLNWDTFFSKKPAIKDTDKFNLNLAFMDTSSGSNTNTWMDTKITTDTKQRFVKIKKDRDLVEQTKTLSEQLSTAFNTPKGLSQEQQATEDWFSTNNAKLWLFKEDASDSQQSPVSYTTSKKPALASTSYYGRLAALAEESIANETAKIAATTWNTPNISTLSYKPVQQKKKSTKTVYNLASKNKASVLKYSAPSASSYHKLAVTDSTTKTWAETTSAITGIDYTKAGSWGKF